MRQRRLKGLDEKLAAYENRKIIDRKSIKGKWQTMFSERQPLYLELGCGKAQFILKLSKAYPERNFVAIEGNRSVMLRALQKAERAMNDKGLTNPGKRPADSLSLHMGEIKSEYIDGGTRRAASVNIHETPSVENSDELNYSADLSAMHDEASLSVCDSVDAEMIAEDAVWFAAPNLIFVNLYMREVGDCFAPDELSGMYLNFSDPWPKERHAARRLTHIGYLKGYGKALRPGSSLEFKTDNEDLFRFSVEQFKICGLEQLDYSEDLHMTDMESAQFMTEYEERFSLRGNPIFYIKVKYPE